MTLFLQFLNFSCYSSELYMHRKLWATPP